MPATAGRVKMPHNNRMTTSATLKTSDIWSKTIGHDPYANQAEEQKEGDAASATSKATADKVKNVMEMAKTQNVTDGSNRDGFTAKLYLGLKQGKVRRSQGGGLGHQHVQGVDPKLQQLLEDPDSSSEDEFVPVAAEATAAAVAAKEKKRKKNKKHKKHRRREDSDDSSSSSDSDSDGSSSREERRRRRREKRKRNKKRKHSSKRHRDESSTDSDDEEDKKRQKRKRSRKESSRRMK
jgi:hypothetical protein